MVELRFCRNVMGPASHAGGRRGVTFPAGKGVQPHFSLPAPSSLWEWKVRYCSRIQKSWISSGNLGATLDDVVAPSVFVRMPTASRLRGSTLPFPDGGLWPTGRRQVCHQQEPAMCSCHCLPSLCHENQFLCRPVPHSKDRWSHRAVPAPKQSIQLHLSAWPIPLTSWLNQNQQM